MDATIRYDSKVAPGQANYRVSEDGGANQIRWSVSEDLGGGLRATGDVGMRFGIVDGLTQSSGARPLFQGETRVGLAGSFGHLRFGRGLTAVQTPIGAADPWGVRTVAGTPYAIGFASDYAAGGEGRIDNAIFYNSPRVGGFSAAVSFSPRKLAAIGATTDATTPLVTTSTKTHQSLHLGYTSGPIALNVGYEQNRVGDTMTPIWGSYNAGFARLIAHYNVVKGGTAADRNGITFGGAAVAVPSGVNTAIQGVAANGEIKNWGVGAVIPMGQLSYRLGYTTWNGTGAPGQKDDTKVGAGVQYDLSKRTFLHANVASQTRKNNTGARPDRDNSRLTMWDAGIVHNF